LLNCDLQSRFSLIGKTTAFQAEVVGSIPTSCSSKLCSMLAQ
jgi:hypothetical protein